MYSINGVPLQNPEYGWREDPSSVFIPDYAARTQSLVIPGRPGVWTLPPQPMDATAVSPAIRTPPQHRDRLRALMMQPNPLLTRTGDPSRGIVLEYQSVASEMWLPAERVMLLKFLMRANDVYMRDLAEYTSGPISLAAPTGLSQQVIKIMPGLSAPVTDMVIRVKGATQGLTITDSQGSWISSINALPEGSYLRYEGGNGAFVTTTDTWTGGTPLFANSGPDPFAVNCKYGVTLGAELTIQTTTRSANALIEVRGRRAYTA